jgi:hypothetical protein
MTLKQIYSVENNRLIIDLPENFKGRQNVMVIVEDVKKSYEDKCDLMKEATNDPLYLSDVKEVMNDFKFVDLENI